MTVATTCAISRAPTDDGNRLQKIANGLVTKYLVDDLNPTGYAQVIEETVSGAAERTYTYGLQRIDEDQVVNSTWTPSFYGYDGMGAVRLLTNAADATTDTYEYDAFGNKLGSTGTTPNNYFYRGEQYDPDLGLYYLRARYYNPLTGRFMSRDPEDGNVQIPATLHKYLYAQGDPVNHADPKGRDAIIDFAIEIGETEEGVAQLEAAKLAVQDELKSECIERVLAEMSGLEMYQGFADRLLYDIAVGDCTNLVAAVP